MEDCERLHLQKEAPLHTMHVVRAVHAALEARLGEAVPSLGELYKAYFAKGGVAYSSLCRPTPEQAISVIAETGGIAVLAHPGRITLAPERMPSFLDGLCRAGLSGIECRYPTHTSEQTEYFLGYCRAHALYITGGSDFHSFSPPERTIGCPPFEPGEDFLQAVL